MKMGKFTPLFALKTFTIELNFVEYNLVGGGITSDDTEGCHQKQQYVGLIPFVV